MRFEQTSKEPCIYKENFQGPQVIELREICIKDAWEMSRLRDMLNNLPTWINL